MRKRKLLALAVIAAVVAVPSAQAHNGDGSGGWKVVASGLDNPRGISIAGNGDLWIAEAGRGGPAGADADGDGVPDNCMPGEEGAPSCFGLSGAFTRVHHGWQKRVVTGLPSAGDEGTGDNALGPSDIVARGNHVTGLIGGGGGSAERALLPAGGELADTMLKINPWSGTTRVFADFAAYETTNNPDGAGIDSDSYGLAQTNKGFLVADAGGNDLLGVSYHKQISTVAVFPVTPVDPPPGFPLPPGVTQIPMDAVPTTVAVRPHDKNIYVGQLTGFPFPMGGASVWAIAPDGSKTAYATGFTTIVDIAWGPKGSLYVLEITSNGLASPDPGAGALIKVWPNGHQETVASTGLVAPTAVAVARNGDVYVANYGTSAGKGEVVDLGKV